MSDRKEHELCFETLERSARDTLVQTMLAGLPGTNTTYSLEEMRVMSLALRDYFV